MDLEGQPEAVFPQDNYILLARDTPSDDYTGATFTVNVDFDDPRTFDGFDENSASRVDGTELQTDATVSISLPDTLLEDNSFSTSGDVRFTFAAFASNVFFQHREESQLARDFEGFAVGSLLVSAGVAIPDVTLESRSNPVRMMFQKTRVCDILIVTVKWYRKCGNMLSITFPCCAGG